MASKSRLAIIAFSALCLVASLYALYVSYRLVTDPGYAPLCDISETVSCQQVFQSAYGKVAGIPIAAGGAIWAALVLVLAVLGLNLPNRERSSRIAAHIFILSTIGLAAVFYFAYASFFVLKQACPVCITMYVGVIGVFIASVASAGSLSATVSNFSRDLGALKRDQTAVTAGVLLAVLAGALLVFFPREADVVSASGEVAPVPIEELSPEQLSEWTKWLDSQPRVADAITDKSAKVVLVKFNDYQCPTCKQTWALYKDVIERYEQSHPGVFKFETRDFPLELECGSGGSHGAACELAVAVRLADAKGKRKEAEAEFFKLQSFSMTRADVTKTLEQIAQIPQAEFDAQYPKVLEAVRLDAQLGQRLNVRGTPTFYLDGILMGQLWRPSYLDAAIKHLLEKPAS